MTKTELRRFLNWLNVRKIELSKLSQDPDGTYNWRPLKDPITNIQNEDIVSFAEKDTLLTDCFLCELSEKRWLEAIRYGQALVNDPIPEEDQPLQHLLNKIKTSNPHS